MVIAQQYKILVLAYTHALSHLSRPLTIAKILRDWGVDVAFAGESSKISFIEGAGFKVLPLPEPDPDSLFGNIRRKRLKFIADVSVRKMIEDDLQIIQEFHPDAILSDGRFTAAISAQIAKVPHIAVVNVSSTAYRALPYVPFFEKIGASGGGFIRDMMRKANLFIEMKVFDHVMPIFSRISRERKLAHHVTATNCLEGADLTLLADIPEYFLSRNLPGNYHYIGPLTWKKGQGEEAPSWWPIDTKGRRLIYITMGTTGEADFFPAVKEMILSSGMTAIVTTGGQIEDLENVPGKLYAEPYLDGDMVAAASDLVVCHGGNGTIYQALSHGKPIVGIPTLPDQAFNMRRVEDLGVGRAIPFKKFIKNPKMLSDAIEDVLANYSVYQGNANKLKASIQQYDGAKLGADLILEYLASNQRIG